MSSAATTAQSSPETTPHPAYRADIDGLRGIAVIGVLFYHAFPKLMAGGFAGVDLFFVISGYLISGIVLKGLERGTFSFKDFYQRRIRRIFPALAIVLATFLVLGWFLLLPAEYRQLAKHSLAAAAFVSNIALWKEAAAGFATAGYFDADSTREPFLHLWSLGIEEQFYLVWPLLLCALWKLKNNRLWFAIALAALSFFLNVRLIAHPSTSFYLPITRFWELLLGCILALAPASGKVAPDPRLRNLCAVAGAGLILAAFLLLRSDRAFPGWWALLPALGATLVIFAGPGSWINNKLLSVRGLVFVGLISYPLYLWHWPLFAFSRILGIASNSVILALTALSVILSWATWRCVETKIRRRRLTQDVFALAASLAMIALISLGLFARNGLAGRPGETTAASLLGDINRHFTPLGCSLGPQKFNICYQSKPGRPDAVMAGDSHAFVLIPGLAAADPRRTWLVVGNFACPPLMGVAMGNPDIGLNCNEPVKGLFDYLGSPGTPRLVVLSFYGYYGETNDIPTRRPPTNAGPSHYRIESDPPSGSKQEAFALGLRNSIRFLMSRNKEVVLILDNPDLPVFPADCVTRPFLRPVNCHVDRDLIGQRQKGLRATAAELQKEFPRLTIFDPLPLVCGENGCDPVRGGASYYRDNTHLSVRGSVVLVKAIAGVIDRPAANASLFQGSK